MGAVKKIVTAPFKLVGNIVGGLFGKKKNESKPATQPAQPVQQVQPIQQPQQPGGMGNWTRPVARPAVMPPDYGGGMGSPMPGMRRPRPRY